jgi:predicted RNA-binding Zn-ribbon protein involved in translation (DUF1610 family)
MVKRMVVLAVAVVIALLFVGTGNMKSATFKDDGKVTLLQGIGIGVVGGDEGKDDKKEEEEETEKEDEQEGDYQLGKVDPNTRKAVYYECPECGDIVLDPTNKKCPICEKEYEKKEIEVEERNGKWYEKGTNIQIVEKEPEEEEEAESSEGEKEAQPKGENKKPQGDKKEGGKGGPGLPDAGIIDSAKKAITPSE